MEFIGGTEHVKRIETTNSNLSVTEIAKYKYSKKIMIDHGHLRNGD
jgi:hypothetical protein